MLSTSTQPPFQPYTTLLRSLTKQIRTAFAVTAQVEVEVVAVILVGFWSEHRREAGAGGLVDLAQEGAFCGGPGFLGPVALDHHIIAIGQFEAQNIKRVGKSMFGNFSIGQIIAAAALVSVAGDDGFDRRAEGCLGDLV